MALSLQDGKASDDVRPLLDLIRLGGLVRQAVKLLKGVEIRHTDETFTIAVLTKFPFYKVNLRWHTHAYDSVIVQTKAHYRHYGQRLCDCWTRNAQGTVSICAMLFRACCDGSSWSVFR